MMVDGYHVDLVQHTSFSTRCGAVNLVLDEQVIKELACCCPEVSYNWELCRLTLSAKSIGRGELNVQRLLEATNHVDTSKRGSEVNGHCCVLVLLTILARVSLSFLRACGAPDGT